MDNTASEPLAGEDQPAAPTSQPPPPSLPDTAGTASPAPDFWLLLALFLVFRLLTLLVLRPGGFIRDWSDFDTYLGIARLSDYGLYPFLHFWLEWPPLVPWLAVGAYQVSLLFPPWTDQRLWFTLILGTVFVLFETGNFALLYRLAMRCAEAETAQEELDGEQERRGWYALRVVVFYALLFTPVYAMLGFFDAIALFFLLLALDLILRGRLVASAMSVGVGFLVKLTPMLFVPVALRRLWDEVGDWRTWLQDAALYVVTSALTVLVLLLPFLLAQPAWVTTAARAMAGRSSWETVWALLEGYYGYGTVGGDRLNPAETSFAVHPGGLPWWLITLAFGLLYLFFWTRPADYRRARHVAGFAGLTVTLFLLYSKGFSPQFLVYLLPFVVLLFPNGRGVAYSLVLTVLNVLEQPVYFVLVPEATWLLTGVIVLRWLTLGALLLEFAVGLWGPAMRWLAPVQRYAPGALAGLLGIALVIGLPLAGHAYAQRRLAEDLAGGLIGYLDSQQARAESEVILVGDQETLGRLAPYLEVAYDLRLAGGDQMYAAAPTTADLIAGLDKAWVVVAGQGGEKLARELDAQGRWLVAYDFGEGGQLRLFAPRGEAAGGGTTPLVPRPPVARLASGANLIGYTLERTGPRQVRVTLYWWATAAPPQSFTVFSQVLDGEGNLVAGHDSQPADGAVPTERWAAGRVYADSHLIQLPADLPPGTYRLVAGMYNVFLNRVAASGPDGTRFEDGAVPLGEMDLP